MSASSDKAEGTLDKAKGKAKEVTGSVTGNKDMENEGKADQTKGSAKKIKGEVKDAFGSD
ncbi:CsbD family protein [Alteromonas ponticola]|uniref:CsbD family protein n=1 Tax=Alteromonas ponticola TaxID=2720613 RepID=A0ABX1QYC4_9ALTE|nr:CsbD family protein [Alteromonas ponticola]NMH59237.1 CsbD family protein [Alteromonas ponticola]